METREQRNDRIGPGMIRRRPTVSCRRAASLALNMEASLSSAMGKGRGLNRSVQGSVGFLRSCCGQSSLANGPGKSKGLLLSWELSWLWEWRNKNSGMSPGEATWWLQQRCLQQSFEGVERGEMNRTDNRSSVGNRICNAHSRLHALLFKPQIF